MIKDLDFSPDGRFLVSCSYDNTVRIWRMRDGFSKLLDLEDENAYSLWCVKFNPDGRYIAVGNYDGMLRIWNVRTSQLVGKWTHGKYVRSVVFTPDGKGLVSGSMDGTWKYWDISLLKLSEPGYGMTKGSTTAQKIELVASSYAVRPSHQFLLNSPFYRAPFFLQNNVRSIATSPGGQWVVSGSGDCAVRIWDLHNGALECTMTGHKNCVSLVDFCPTGSYLASGSGDGSVALWKYEAA